MALAASTFIVQPDIGLLLWAFLTWFALGCGIATALKARWGWFLAGLLSGGLPWIYAAFLVPAADESVWSRRAARRAGSRA